jgi:hypothetical protein
MAASVLRLPAVLPALVLFVAVSAPAQQDGPLRPLQRLAETGRIEALREGLSNNKHRLSDDPGYVFLQGRAESDGEQALRFYQEVADNYPSSIWCEQALLKLSQYHYAIGAYAAADRYLTRLRTDYPGTPLLRSAAVAVPAAKEAARGDGGYAVQVGAFDRSEDAQDYAQTITRWGFPVEVREKTVGRKQFAAVWVGRFTSKDDARNCQRNIKKKYGVDGLVVAR